MLGWHHRLKGHEFEQVVGDGEGRGSLACCSSRGHRVGHDCTTEQRRQVSCDCVPSYSLFPWLSSQPHYLSHLFKILKYKFLLEVFVTPLLAELGTFSLPYACFCYRTTFSCLALKLNSRVRKC